MHRLARAHKAHVQYMRDRESLGDSDDDDGPQDEDAWLLEDLKVLAFLYTKLRDREMLIDLIFEVRNVTIFHEKCPANCFCVGFHC